MMELATADDAVSRGAFAQASKSIEAARKHVKEVP